MQRIFVVQGEHWSVPGKPMTAHATMGLAQREANKLVNIMLADAKLPTITEDASDEERDSALERVREDSINGGTDCDVWITPLDVEEEV
jgi:hypothetical protein